MKHPAPESFTYLETSSLQVKHLNLVLVLTAWSTECQTCCDYMYMSINFCGFIRRMSMTSRSSNASILKYIIKNKVCDQIKGSRKMHSFQL